MNKEKRVPARRTEHSLLLLFKDGETANTGSYEIPFLQLVKFHTAYSYLLH